MKHTRRFKERRKIARDVAENNLAWVLKAWNVRQSYSRRKWEYLKLLECCSNLLHASVTSCLLCRRLISVSERCKLWFGVRVDVGGRGVIFTSPPSPSPYFWPTTAPLTQIYFLPQPSAVIKSKMAAIIFKKILSTRSPKLRKNYVVAS